MPSSMDSNRSTHNGPEIAADILFTSLRSWAKWNKLLDGVIKGFAVSNSKFIAIHAGLLVALVAIGYVVSVVPQPYAVFLTTVGSGISLYVTTINILYHKDQRVYLAANRLWLMIGSKHTLWQVDFQFDLRPERFRDYEKTLDKIEETLRASRLGHIRLKERLNTRMDLVLEDQIGLVFQVDEDGVHLHFDPKLPVPSSLYERRVKLLQSVCESIVGAIRPIRYRFTLEVFFREGMTNPYYGYFVHKIPVGKLQDFKVVIRLDDKSDTEIRVDTDHVSVEATRIPEGFDALSNVLRLKPLLQGTA